MGKNTLRKRLKETMRGRLHETCQVDIRIKGGNGRGIQESMCITVSTPFKTSQVSFSSPFVAIIIKLMTTEHPQKST